jgi:hypothetical protein
MIWREIFLNKDITKKDLAKVFSELFDIDVNKINLINNVTDFRDNDILTYIIDPSLGDFCLKLDCFTSFKVDNEFNSISSLCTRIGCRALISNDNGDDKDNPYSFVLFEPSGQVKKVKINAQLFDKYDEFKITQEMPYVGIE